MNKLKAIRILVFAVAFASQSILLGQVVQNQRHEILMALNDEPFDVFGLKEYGLLLMRDVRDPLLFRTRTWEVQRLDTAFNQRWDIRFDVPNDLNILGFEQKGGYGFILFQKGNDPSGDYVLKKVNLRNGQLATYDIRNVLALQLRFFEVIGENVIFGGEYSSRPSVVLYSTVSDLAKILPDVFKDNAELLDITVDDINNVFTVLTSERTEDRRYPHFVKVYSDEGDLIRNTELVTDENHALLEGRVGPITTFGQSVAGTYSRRKSFAAQGFYIGHIAPDGKQKLSYFALGELENFFSYLSERRRKALQSKYTPKGDNNRSRVVNYRFMLSELKQSPTGYYVQAEAYMPQYNPVVRNFNTFAAPTPGMSQFNTVLTGYRYLFAVVLAFDFQGNLLWDQSLEINDIEPNVLEPLVYTYFDGKKAVMLYGGDDEIRSAAFEGSNVLQAKEVNKIELKYPNDKTRTNNYRFSGLEHWFDKYFVAYGVQNIRNTDLEDVNRKVFYLNKVYFK